jgi:uncharacterized membrane protein
MMLRCRHLWEALRSSLWFVPALMIVVAAGLSFVCIALDRGETQQLIVKTGWVWGGGPDGAREVLSTIAGSMITVAGVVFSITIVAFQLASSQFGPRLLHNFMRDTGNQVVLGTFIATFLYSLLVLRTVRGEGNDEFVPYLSVALAIVLAVVSLGVLIYFIHHVSVSIQAAHVIAVVNDELVRAIERLFPQKLGHAAAMDSLSQEAVLPETFASTAHPIAAADSGYLQTIDTDKLMAVAKAHNLLLDLHCRPGHFVEQNRSFMRAWPAGQVNEQVTKQIDAAFIWGPERTLTQDVEFAVNQLVEVAVRALSPGINDPFTAIRCIDRLGAVLCQLTERVMPSPYRYDDTDTLRVIVPPVTFASVTDAAFNQIRQYGGTSVAVTIRLLECLAAVAAHTYREEDRAALLRHAVMIEQDSHEGIPQEHDLRDVQERFQAVVRALEQRRAHTALLQ